MESRAVIDASPEGPPPTDPAPSGTQPAMVYVSDDPRWEYKTIERANDAPLPSQSELDGWGREGWELTGVLSRAGRVYFYFKRVVG